MRKHVFKTLARITSAMMILFGILSAVHAKGGGEYDLRFDHVLNLGMKGRPVTMQDNDGFMWFGGHGVGLYRYDGYELKEYGVGPGLMANGIIHCIEIDRQNPDIFWIATGGGFHRFDKDTESFTVYRHDPADPASLGSDATFDIIQNGSDPDILWIGTANGFNRFDKKTGKFKRYEPDPNDPDTVNFAEVWRFIEDRADPGVLWIGTYGGGLDKFEKDTETFTHHVHDPEDPGSIAKNEVWEVIQDRDDPNILWLGFTGKGLGRFDKRTGRFTHLVSGSRYVAVIHDDGRGRLWLGGWSKPEGLIIFGS